MLTFQYDDVAAKTLSPATCKAIVEQLHADINSYCIKEFTDEHRTHLGASIIGDDCWRKSWYTFRWVKSQVFDGRMLRLFNRGHLEEARFIKWLRGAGCTVWEVDPNTGKQFRIWGVSGHYGGSSDSVGILPYFPDLPILLEFKTHNYKSFSNLINKGLRLAKHEHFAQMSSYGKHYNFRYGLYVAVNKNDDDLHLELVELDWNLADGSIIKASEIINSRTPPKRISDNPTFFDCKWCSYSGICHDNAPVEINCRSCRHAVAAENASWHCNKFNAIIPPEFIKTGCPDHVSIALEQ